MVSVGACARVSAQGMPRRMFILPVCFYLMVTIIPW